MTVQAYLLAFGNGAIRTIDIPDNLTVDASNDDLLNLAFRYGQNDCQPKPLPSLSVGDAIELPDGSLHEVAPFGFNPIK